MSSIIPNREQGAVLNMIQGIVIGVVCTALSYGVGLWLGWITGLDWLEVFAVFTSYVCTFLCVVERRINYPIGAVSTAAYCVLFWQVDLLASMTINAFLSVYLVYGWLRWRSDSNTRPVTKMTTASWAVHILVALSGYLVVVLIATALGGHLAWTDSFILAGTILAQFMLDNKHLENWWVWFAVDAVAIYTYFAAGLTLVGWQYVLFLLNCFYGIYAWRGSQESVTTIPETVVL